MNNYSGIIRNINTEDRQPSHRTTQKFNLPQATTNFYTIIADSLRKALQVAVRSSSRATKLLPFS